MIKLVTCADDFARTCRVGETLFPDLIPGVTPIGEASNLTYLDARQQPTYPG
jgi:hypothetical protein